MTIDFAAIAANLNDTLSKIIRNYSILLHSFFFVNETSIMHISFLVYKKRRNSKREIQRVFQRL